MKCFIIYALYLILLEWLSRGGMSSAEHDCNGERNYPAQKKTGSVEVIRVKLC
jgi:hypothetical protein